MRTPYIVSIAIFSLLLQGCASTSGETLKIDTRNVLGIQYMPDELTKMLRDLGYNWIPIMNPEINKEVKTVRKYGEYRMRFEYANTKQVRIDVRIRILNNFTRLHFYEPGRKTLSSSSMNLLLKLQERAELVYGERNVSF